jgi:hypothetical protein
MRLKHRAYVILLLSALGLPATSFSADTRSDRPTDLAAPQVQHVVIIWPRDEGGEFLGTGTIVSFDGLIITAKHILFSTNELTSGIPNFRSTVNIEFKDWAKKGVADLIAVHPYLDIAILKLRQAPASAIPAEIAVALDKKDSLIVVGNRQGYGSGSGSQLYQVMNAGIDEMDRDGHIAIDRNVEKGFSGGPAFKDDKLVGVVEYHDGNRSYVVPIERAIPYFRRVGIYITEKGATINEIDDFGDITTRLNRYQKLMALIQSDFHCTATVSGPFGVGSAQIQALQIAVSCDGKLRIQPTLYGKAVLVSVPLFDSIEFRNLQQGDRMPITALQWISSGATKFADLKHDLDDVLQEYKQAKNLDLRASHIVELDAILQVTRIRDTGYIEPPTGFTICFRFLKGVEKVTGQECGEEFDYVKSHLPR